MTSCVELELTIQPWTENRYALDMKLTLPDSNDETAPLGDAAPVLVDFDMEQLRELQQQPSAYGEMLGTSLLKDPAAAAGLRTGREVAQRSNAPLRLRLNLGGGPMSPLHALRWETLVDPETQTSLGISRSMFLSRFLGSGDLRPIRLRSRSELRVLLAIANPQGLDRFGLTSLDVAKERKAIRDALGDISVTCLSDEGHVTLTRICDVLDPSSEDEGYDVLYLVCHGTMLQDMSQLWLETDEGQIARVSGSEFAVRMYDLRQRPNLIVLASCQSASAEQGEALASVAPRLARVGIPAVLAMQDDIEVETSRRFMTAFFSALQERNQIDEAVSLARGAVADAPDWWVPLLLMRLRSGAIWYTREGPEEFKQWSTLIGSMQDKQCIPILGPGLTERFVGTSRQLAEFLGEQYDFPLASTDEQDLAQVMQYLANDHDERFARRARDNAMRRFIMHRCADDLGGDVRTLNLPDLLRLAWQRKDGQLDPLRVLAKLPCPMYVTASPDDLLTEALRSTPASRGDGGSKTPLVDHCDWTHEVSARKGPSHQRGYAPTPDRPLVYHLFGRLDPPDSQVVTETNYLDFLITIHKERERIPNVVWSALSEANLLFIGFEMDGWPLRILVQTIMNLSGRFRAPRRTNIAVQIDPQSAAITDSARTRRYLEKYFSNNDLQIYWGSIDHFIQRLSTAFP